jgi:hypothetical protein
MCKTEKNPRFTSKYITTYLLKPHAKKRKYTNKSRWKKLTESGEGSNEESELQRRIDGRRTLGLEMREARLVMRTWLRGRHVGWSCVEICMT